MSEILRKADIQLNATLTRHLLASFKSANQAMTHLLDQLDRKEQEELDQVTAKYEQEKRELLEEIALREGWKPPILIYLL